MQALAMDMLRKRAHELSESNQRLLVRIIERFDEQALEDDKKKGSYNGDQLPCVFRRSASQPF